MRTIAILSILLLPRAAERPNIVFVLADDLGWTDAACYGSGYYETPNIDRLCAQGMKFTDYHTNGPNCAPTRASLMSGRYGPRHGIYTVGTGARGDEQFRKMIPAENKTQLPLGEVTVAQALKAAGYVTGMFGKWHLGQSADYHPAKRGFDVAIESMGRHFEFKTNPSQKVDPKTYLADFLTDQAVRFIESNKDRPFFLYLPHFAVHAPWDAKPDYVPHFKEKKPAGGHKDPVYAAMIQSVDESVGRVLAKLDELRLAENTIVIFSSDNGGVGSYESAGASGAREITSNAPLHGGKGMLYEGGHRVPFIVRWPGVVKPGSACGAPIASIDLYPTLLEVAGSKGDPNHKLDGVSLVPLLKETGKLERDALYWHFPGYLEASVKRGTWRTTPTGAIRAGDWKLIEFFETGKVELYNLADDLGETRDVAAKMPEKAKELREKLAAWRTAVNAPMPKPK